MRRTVTLASVGRAAGVSHQTVSNVINRPSIVSLETRELVEFHLEALGYRGNAAARALRTRRSNLFGLVVPSMTHSMYSEVAEAVVSQAEQRGYTVLIAVTHRDAVKEKEVIEALIKQGVSGFLIAAAGPDSYGCKLASDADIPAIEILNRTKTSVSDSFVADNRAGGRLATEHLIERGHTVIGHIAGLPTSTGIDRRKGYSDALSAAGLEVDENLIVEGGYSREGGRNACGTLLTGRADITAIFCASDVMAYGAMEDIASRTLKIPSDIALVGFDDMEMSSLPGIALSSVGFGPGRLARQSVDRLVSQIDGEPANSETPHKIMACRFIARASSNVDDSVSKEDA